jgi:hypothetical protein
MEIGTNFVIYLFIAEELENQENRIHECIMCKPTDRSEFARRRRH